MNIIEPGSSKEGFNENVERPLDKENFSSFNENEASVEKEHGFEVSSSEQDDSYAKIISKVKNDSGQSLTSSVSDDAADLSLKTDAESQIQHLVDVAMEKGVIHSIKVAKHFEDNYIMDAFHDRLLADDLHDALLAKGLIEKE